LKNEMLVSLLGVQPYMISVAQIQSTRRNQKAENSNLLLNGTNDLQVSVGEAELLKKSKPDAELVIIDAMNHVLRR
jgi:hypothetical protein